MCTAGQAVHILPIRQPVIGITAINDTIYVLRRKREDAIEVYDDTTYQLERFITVPISTVYGLVDIVSCDEYRCLYIADSPDKCVHRLDLENHDTRWEVEDELSSLSVNADHNVLVTCPAAGKIKEFGSYGELLRVIVLAFELVNPLHAVQLRSGEFIVCHGHPADDVHRVCLMSADGTEVRSMLLFH